MSVDHTRFAKLGFRVDWSSLISTVTKCHMTVYYKFIASFIDTNLTNMFCVKLHLFLHRFYKLSADLLLYGYPG